MANDTNHVHISAKHNWLDLKLGEVWRYRDLILLFTKRTFTVKYKQTVLGPLWLFLNPFLSSIVHTIVFGKIAGLSTDGIPMLLFHLTGSAMWAYFSSSLTTNSSAFINHANLFGKVYFPRLTIPISNALSALVQLGIQMLLIFGFLLYHWVQGEISPNLAAWWTIPFVLLQLGLLGMGVGIIISSLTTKYRDLAVLVSFGVNLWMYATPVVYPLSQLANGWMRTLLLVNPVTMPLEIFRYAVLGAGTVLPGYAVLSWAVTIVTVLLGILIFNRIERTFMDTV